MTTAATVDAATTSSSNGGGPTSQPRPRPLPRPQQQRQPQSQILLRGRQQRRPQQISRYALTLLCLAVSVFTLSLLSLLSTLSSQSQSQSQTFAGDDNNNGLRDFYNPVSRSLDYFSGNGNNNNNFLWQQQQEQRAPESVGDSVITKVEYPVEDPVDNPPLQDGNATFSSCLLVMDDNHRLPEWLAYHWHVLPLRTVVVASDPRSRTNPTHIFNQWRRRGLYVEEWTDVDFWKPDLRPLEADAAFQTKRDRHRGRQKFFYRSCLQRMKQLNRTWVSLHDSDEFIVYNHPGGTSTEGERKFREWQSRLESKVGKRPDGAKLQVLKPSQVPPSTAEAGAMIRYIRHEQRAGLSYYQSPCIGIPRLMFGATGLSTRREKQNLVPPGYDADQFDTLRYRHHARRNDFVKNALGKVIIDVSRVDVARTPYFESLHRPIKTICGAPWHNDWESGLRINHYLGSWESYSFRDDSRRGGERSWEQWEYKATTNSDGGTDDNIRPWLDGFVKSEERSPSGAAAALLRHAGLPKGYRNANTTAWKLLPDKLAKILSTNSTKANDNKMVAFDAWVRAKYGGNGVGKATATERR